MICLALQAESMGLVTHQMGGFDAEVLKSDLGLPDQLDVMSVTALGYGADADSGDEVFHAMELEPRRRKPLAEIVHAASWGNAWRAPAGSG